MSGREYAELKSLSCRTNRNWFNTRDPWFDPPEPSEEEIAEWEQQQEDDDDTTDDNETDCSSCVHYKDYKCGNENVIKCCECPKCLFQSKENRS